MRCVLPVILTLCGGTLLPGPLYAQDPAPASVEDARLPRTVLQNARPRLDGERGVGPAKATAALRGPRPAIDSLTTWSDQFTADGFDQVGNPQSVWPYTMMGTAPESGRPTTFNAPIVPVTVELLAPSGHVAVVNGSPLRLGPGPEILNAVVRSPMFESFTYPSGRGQFNDQMMRTQFWNRLTRGRDEDEDDRGGWHVLLRPLVRPARVMQVPFGKWFVILDDQGKCCVAALVESSTFVNLLFPATEGDPRAVIGAAQAAGDITTRDMSTFLFNNVLLFDRTPSACCTIGFHSYDVEPGDARNGFREKRFVMNYSSWMAEGLFSGFSDITAISHEIAETFADPFVNNATPWWLSVDPFTGGGLCQNNLETGDVIEVLLSNPTYALTMNGRTYHPQNEALFSYFARESPSTARQRVYSFPDETTVRSLSPGPLGPGCVPK